MADPLAPLHKVQAAARHKFSENIPEGTKSTSNKEYRKPAAERSKRTAAPKRGSKGAHSCPVQAGQATALTPRRQLKTLLPSLTFTAEKHGKGALPQLDTAKLEHLFKAADAVGLFSATSQSAASKPAAQPDPLQSISFDTLRISSPRETADMRSAAAAQLTYSQRCQMESDALLAACPPHLRHVSQTYLKQAEAFALADQCNRGMPVLPEPEIILSADSCAPAPTRPGSSAVPSGPVAQPAQQKPAQDLPEQEKPAENADMSNSKHNEGLFANVPSFYTRPKAADPTLEADGAEEPPRQKQQKTEEAAATAQTRAEKYRELLAAVNASIQAPGAHLDAGTEPPAQSPLPAGAVGAGAPANGATAAPERGGSPGNAPPVERREEAIRVFCVEKANERTGAYYRTFTAASYSWVWSTYLATAPKDLHYYEIIREGRACHLYFDLEYARGPTLNAAVDGDALVDKLLLHVEATLR